jgi:anhydro-N-acetylmuramic acid kinase
MTEPFEIIGLMSGSSLDGLDAAWCTFQKDDSGNWTGNIVEAMAFSFPSVLQEKLGNIRQATGLVLMETDAAFVRFSAEAIQTICTKTGRKPMAVASHGHTVFHSPSQGFTTQIGNGGLLSGLCGFPVVCDFRTLDVGLGGQGAPLVPGAERFLFFEYDACLNLGGICNISFPGGKTKFPGFDIAPCNQLLNHAASWLNLDYDHNGKIASEGSLIPELILAFQEVPYYAATPPKSLGNEDIALHWKTILDSFSGQPKDAMHTISVHVALEIAKAVLKSLPSGKMLVTGGGAYHLFLIEQIRKALGNPWEVEVPNPQLVSFKEAYCFAFLGLKRLLKENNCFADVTGAKSDSCCGAVYGNL